MVKNRIIELFSDDIKTTLYTTLQQNKNIMYTKNERSVPLRTKSGIENIYQTEANNRTYTIVVEPDKIQLEYFDVKLLNIDSAIENSISIDDLKKFITKANKSKFIHAMESSNFSFLSQYDSDTIYQYILSLC